LGGVSLVAIDVFEGDVQVSEVWTVEETEVEFIQRKSLFEMIL
jgi:hypothetical protein